MGAAGPKPQMQPARESSVGGRVASQRPQSARHHHAEVAPRAFDHPLREEGVQGGGTGLIATAVDHVCRQFLPVALTHWRCCFHHSSALSLTHTHTQVSAPQRNMQAMPAAGARMTPAAASTSQQQQQQQQQRPFAGHEEAMAGGAWGGHAPRSAHDPVSGRSRGGMGLHSDAKVASRKTIGFRVGDRSRGRFATPADSARHGGTPYSHVHVHRESLRFVHRSRAILSRRAKP
jgi:hypothetical protein